MVGAEAAAHVLPGGGVAVGDPHVARPSGIRPEVVERPVDRRLRQIVTGKAELRLVRQAVIDHGPVGPALALEPLVVHVLVEVQEWCDVVPLEQLGRLSDLREVGVVVGTGCRLDGLVDDTQAHAVEALALQEAGVVLAETRH